jgi:Lipocalin-like domain
MWRLDKFESLDSASNKWVDDTAYRGYSGYILYDGKGHVGVHLTPKGYKEFKTTANIDSLNKDQLKAVVRFYKLNFVYFGDYTLLNDSTIQHKRLSATEPGDWGTRLTRFFSFNRDTLILKLSGKPTRVRWIKL